MLCCQSWISTSRCRRPDRARRADASSRAAAGARVNRGATKCRASRRDSSRRQRVEIARDGGGAVQHLLDAPHLWPEEQRLGGEHDEQRRDHRRR